MEEGLTAAVVQRYLGEWAIRALRWELRRWPAA